MNPALIIFIKNPVKGRVKTRLAASIGDERALAVYLQLLSLTRDAALEAQCTRLLFYSDFIPAADEWAQAHFHKFVQRGADLGARMKAAFAQAFESGYGPVAIIGSDCPELSPHLINSAFEQLLSNDFVLGPAHDGGYYLLGMRRFSALPFDDIKWSTDEVLSETLRRIEASSSSFTLLPVCTDVDTIEELRLFPDLFPGF